MFTPFAFIKRQVSAAIAAAQRVLLAGPFTTFNTPVGNNAAKLINASSQIDTTFNVGSGPNDNVYASAFDENNKLIIGGAFTTYSGSFVNYITRINTDGTRDTTFNIGTGFSGGQVYTILPVSGSKVLIGGDFTTYSGSVANKIVRLNSNGSIDSTFAGSTNPALDNTVYTVATQSDGKIIVGGYFNNTTYNSLYLAKLTPQLNPDTTFNPITGLNGQVYAFATQSDGKIIMGGNFTTYSGSTVNRLVRINTNGTRDTTFNVGTGFNVGEVDVIRVQPDNKILVGGSYSTYSGSAASRIVRINTDGTKDTSFNIGTGFNNGQVYDLQLQSDGKIIAVGTWTLTYSGSSAIRIARINPSGSLDTTFNSGTTGFSANQYSAQIQNDGKIIVVGVNGTYSGSAAQRIRRINTNGTLDTTFNIGTAGLNNTTYRAKIQPDQKILVLGAFTTYSGSAINRIARINTNGTLDTTFNVGTGFNTATQVQSALELDSSGSIYVGSQFTTYNNVSVNYFVKLTSSGSIITGSGQYSGFNNVVNSLLVDSTGSVYVGGAFGAYTTPNNSIVRLNTDGTKDTSFQIGSGFDTTVTVLAVQPDNKIVVGGAFTTYSGSTNNYIVRLNSNGTKDTSFNMGGGFNGLVANLALENSGKILAMGSFSFYSGSTATNLTRISANGTQDTNFINPSVLYPGALISILNSSLVVDNSGSIHTVTGSPSTFTKRYDKFNSSGSIDTNGLYITNGVVTSLAIDSSNNVFLLGAPFTASRTNNAGIIALSNSGNTTSSLFNPGIGFFSASLNLPSGNPSISTKTPSGNIWLAGNFRTYSGSAYLGDTYNYTPIIINQQGNLIGTGITQNLTALTAQSDGKILAGTNGGYLAYRYNSDGTQDTTFNPGNDQHIGPVYTIKTQSTGDILIGGNFYYYDIVQDGYDEGGNPIFINVPSSPYYLTKFNNSGSQLALNTEPNLPIYNINVLPDDSFIVTGEATFFSGTGSAYIVKLDRTGSIVTSYNVGTGFNGIVYTSTLQPDGKIIAAGQFTTYSGSTVNRIARIDTNGTLDTTFNPGAGFNTFNSRESKILVDNLGKINIAGGGFTSYSGSLISGYVRLNSNGTRDTTAPSGSFSPYQPVIMELLD